MGRKLALLAAVVVAAGLAGFWILTKPQTLAAADLAALAAHKADAAKGRYLFHIGGCANCHVDPDPDKASPEELGGGMKLASPFGTFVAPNISPDAEFGIGGWTTAEFVNAMKFGTGRDGEHLYPAFPYASYQHMSQEDLADLKAYLDTLPKVKNRPPEHELPFPFNIRRAVGAWKLLYVHGQTMKAPAGADPKIARGAYLVNGPGHCGECHTPRNLIGGMIAAKAFSGGPNLGGEGTVYNITPDPKALGSWELDDILALFQFGTTPAGNAMGGEMGKVRRELKTLTEADQEAIAAYLKSLPAIASEYVRKPKSG